MYTSVCGFSIVCSVLCGRFTSSADGIMSVDVIIKNMSSRNMTSAMDDIEKALRVSNCFLSAIIAGIQ